LEFCKEKELLKKIQCQFLTKNINPFGKEVTFQLFENDIYSIESLVFYLHRYQIIYFSLLERKTTFKENANF